MTQLTRNMYQAHEVGPFGLTRGQMREPFVRKNLYWYNKSGDWLGHGDLNVQDLDNIANKLEPGEVFVLLPESAFIRNAGHDNSRPGIDFIVDEALLVVVPHLVLEVNRYGRFNEEEKTHRLRDRFTGKELQASFITEEQLRVLLTA